MTPEEARERNIEYLLLSAEQSLASARAELSAGRHRFAVNRVYYACFYAASAVLLGEALHFVRHAGVRAALHEHLVRPGRLSAALGGFYDRMFKRRHEADYGAFVEFEPPVVQEWIATAEQSLAEMRRILAR